MDKAILDSVWIPNEILPTEFVVVEVCEAKGKLKTGREYTFYVLKLADKLKNLFEYEVKFGDKNFMIFKHGAQPDAWVGKVVNIHIGPTGYKQLF